MTRLQLPPRVEGTARAFTKAAAWQIIMNCFKKSTRRLLDALLLPGSFSLTTMNLVAAPGQRRVERLFRSAAGGEDLAALGKQVLE
jgi:hypothetical protein